MRSVEALKTLQGKLHIFSQFSLHIVDSLVMLFVKRNFRNFIISSAVWRFVLLKVRVLMAGKGIFSPWGAWYSFSVHD